MYARLIQSSKKSSYLESRLNQLLGLHSDGSDTEDNVESITELDDGAVSDPVTANSSSQLEKEIPQISGDSPELIAHKSRESSHSSYEMQGNSSETCDSDEIASPALENSQPQERSSPVNGLINSPVNNNDFDQNQFSASDEEIMNESEDSFDTMQLNCSNNNNESQDTIEKTSTEIEESCELYNELPFVDGEQSELEIQHQNDRVSPASSCDNIENVNSSADLNDVKDISQIRVGLKKMVAKAKATAAIRDTETQDLLSQNSNLKNLLEKVETEKLELVRKEVDMK